MSDVGIIPLRLDQESSRTLFLHGTVAEETIQPVIEGIIDLNAASPELPITLVISTYGGSIHEMFALYDTMCASVAPIHTVGLGKIMSAGCLLLAAGRKGYRTMGRHARLMYHLAYGAAVGDMFQQENDLAEFRREQHTLDVAVAECCGKTLDEVQAVYKTHQRMDKFMNADEALAFGFVDSIIGVKR